MNLLNYYKDNNINSFDQVEQLLSSSPFNLSVRRDGDLYRLIYDENKSDLSNDIVRECCGIILDANQVDKVVCYSLNKTEDIEVRPESTEYHVNSINLSNWNELRVEELVDGTLVRLYYYDSKWYTSTKKVIDASNSYWHSSKSFHDLFVESSSNLDYSKLNKDHCYYFIMKHPENRIVTEYKEKSIVHVGTRNLVTLQELEENIGVPKPRRCNFLNFDELISKAKNLHFYIPGYMISDKDFNRVKVQGTNYLNIKELKGNVPNMEIRCLQLRKQNQLSDFLIYYPEYSEKFKHVEVKILKQANSLLQKYISRRIKKEQVELLPIEREMLYKIHGLYLMTRIKIKFSSVYHIINSSTVTKIGILIGLIRDKRLDNPTLHINTEALVADTTPAAPPPTPISVVSEEEVVVAEVELEK